MDCNQIVPFNTSQIEGYFDKINQEIVIYNNSEEENLKTLRHENCHYLQEQNQKEKFSCDYKLQMFMNEIEAYLSEDFPICRLTC